MTESTTSPPSEHAPLAQLPAHLLPHDTNTIDIKLSSLSLKNASSPLTGKIRAISTLGAWTGASLVTNLRVKGLVEIERERFMTHGLVEGAVAGKKEAIVAQETVLGRSRQSLGSTRAMGVEKGGVGWSLGVWA